MSGIIGGAGSKSGVISTTELDYEEGTWTPTSSVTLVAFDVGTGPHYTKIGRLVTVNGALATTTSVGSSDFIIAGLPFTNTGSAQGAGSIYMRDLGTVISTSSYLSILCAAGAQFYIRRGGRTNNGDNVHNYMDGDTNFWFSLTYETTL
jgi:hypothetical protein